MIENKPVFISINVEQINNYHKDYELVELYTQIHSNALQQAVTLLGSQAYIPVPQIYSNTVALMKLRKTQEILYGEIK